MTTASSRPAAVLSLGRIYCDMVFQGLDHMPQLGREIFAKDFALTPGGGALITAAHLAGLGRPAILLARYGTDALSTALYGQIESLGLDLNYLDRDASAGPQLTAVMVNDGDRAFVSRRAGHARPSTFEAALANSGATHLHIAEYATLHEMSDAISLAKSHGLTVSLDPSWDNDLIGDSEFLQRTMGVDVFMPNLEEAYALSGRAERFAALQYLQQHFAIVVLKAGADGGLLAVEGDIISQPSPKVTVIDTTGAGDAFNAGFLHAWLDGVAPADCLASAIAAGSRSVQAAGGTGSLGRATVGF